jgi:hypothetical protein
MRRRSRPVMGTTAPQSEHKNKPMRKKGADQLIGILAPKPEQGT